MSDKGSIKFKGPLGGVMGTSNTTLDSNGAETPITIVPVR